jgi:hypothetical protein
VCKTGGHENPSRRRLPVARDLHDDVGEQLGEATRSGATEGACEFTRRMLPPPREAVAHEDMTPELAKLLTTRTVEVEYRVESGVRVRDS